MPSFALPLVDIDEQPKHHRFALDASWLREALADTGMRPPVDAVPGEIDVTVQRTESDILVRGRLRTRVATDCARCLEDAVFTVDADLTTLFQPESKRPAPAQASKQAKSAGAPKPDAAHGKSGQGKSRPDERARPHGRGSQAELDELDEEDDEIRDYYAGDDLVLDGVVRELIVLEEPMQPLCRPDCPGIPIPEGVRPPADFGREAGVSDPRLAPLAGLKQKLTRA